MENSNILSESTLHIQEISWVASNQRIIDLEMRGPIDRSGFWTMMVRFYSFFLEATILAPTEASPLTPTMSSLI